MRLTGLPCLKKIGEEKDAGFIAPASARRRDGMTPNQRQEELSLAYVHAIAAHAGLGYTERRTDYGIDLSLYEIAWLGSRFGETGTVLDLQVKSTVRGGRRLRSVSYDLDVRAYENLRSRDANNLRILVLVVFARDPALRVSQTEERLTIRHCAYWLCLEGAGPTRRRKSVRV
jgi:hypothetical protein